MKPTDSTKKTIARLHESVGAATFPVMVEGQVIHFPIHHRHAPIGTEHRWSDGHLYRKTVSGWEMVHEPGSAEKPGHPSGSADLKKITTARGPETPEDHHFYDQVKKYIAGTGPYPSGRKISNARAMELANHAKAALVNQIASEPPTKPVSNGHEVVPNMATTSPHQTKPSPVAEPERDGKPYVDFRNGMHAVMVKGDKGYEVAALHGKASDAAADAADPKWHHGPLGRPKDEVKAAPATSEPVFSIVKQGEFERALKVGDEVELRWTNNHNYYAARAKLRKVNDGSVRGILQHDVGGDMGYPAGREIVVPTMASSYTMNSKWSHNNGVFPVGPKTPAAQPEKMAAHAAVLKGHGHASDYKLGDEVTLHEPEYKNGPVGYGGPQRHVVAKVDKTNNRLGLRRLANPNGYVHHVNLDTYPHRIEKHAATKRESDYVEVSDKPFDGTHIPHAWTHVTVDSAGNESGSNSRHQSEQSAKEAAAKHNAYHTDAAYKVHVRKITRATPPNAERGPAEPKMEPYHKTYYSKGSSMGGAEVRHYDTNRERTVTGLAKTHAVVDSNTGEVISLHGDEGDSDHGSFGGSYAADAASAYMKHPNGKPNGKKAHVETLRPKTQADVERYHAHLAAEREKMKKDGEEFQRKGMNFIKGPEQIAPKIPAKPDHVTPEMHDAVTKFAHQVAQAKYDDLKANGYDHEVHVPTSTPHVHYKKGYAYVDIGGSGKYMIALEKPKAASVSHLDAGDVVGIKGYGVPHTGKRHGNVLKGDAKPARF